MYARLRATSTTPSICVVCAHLSRSKAPSLPDKRCYAAQAVLTSLPKKTEVGLNGRCPSTTQDISASPKQPSPGTVPVKLDASAKTVQAKQKSHEQSTRAARKALREAQEAERRRRALSILGKTTKFVAAVQETPLEPTLADLEHLKPRYAPLITLKFIHPEPSSRLHRRCPSDAVVERYGIAFQALVDTLSKRFRRKQLLKLLKEGMQQKTTPRLGTPRPYNGLKTSQLVAEEIVRWLWDWPHITEVQKRKEYLTTKSERVFPISTSEFFLLLGSDGSSLLTLTESYSVVLKSVKRTEDTFALVMEGSSFMLDQLATVLTERKKAIISENVHVDLQNTHQIPKNSSQQRGPSIRPDLVQRLSKLSNALVEDKGNNMFRISAHQRRSIALALRLVTRASQQEKLPPPSLLVHLPNLKDSTPNMMFPHKYALFPFEFPNAETLPWQWTSTGSLSALPSSSNDQSHASLLSPTQAPLARAPYLFRARKVSEWLGQSFNSVDAPNLYRGLRDGLGRLLSSTGQPHTLRNALGLPQLNPSHLSNEIMPRERKVTASTGHVIFTAAPGLDRAFLPPFSGSWVFPALLDWMKKDEGRVSFIPSPSQPLKDPFPSTQNALNRLVYRALPTGVPTLRVPSPESLGTLKFEILLPKPSIGRRQLGTDETRLGENGSNRSRVIESMYDDAMLSQEQSVQSPEHIHTSSPATPHPRLWHGTESLVNVMLPDRPMDMQLSLFDSISLPREAEPTELIAYASDLTHFLTMFDGTSRPDPPLSLTYAGTRWTLDANATIRWSSQTIAVDPSIDPEEASINAVTETTVDLESDRQDTTSQVTCSEINTIPAWRKFLCDCDRLTWMAEAHPALFSKLSDNAPVDPDGI